MKWGSTCEHIRAMLVYMPIVLLCSVTWRQRTPAMDNTPALALGVSQVHSVDFAGSPRARIFRHIQRKTRYVPTEGIKITSVQYGGLRVAFLYGRVSHPIRSSSPISPNSGNEGQRT